MRPFRIDFDLDDPDADGLADGNSSAGATLTLDGILTSGGSYTSADGLAHKISIIDLGAHVQTTATYTFIGTDADNKAQTEDLVGPGASATVETIKYYKTITSITIASPVAGSTVDVGTADEVTTKGYVMPHSEPVAACVQVDVTGTINFDVQITLQDIQDQSSAAPFDITDQEDIAWINDGNFGSKSADLLNQLAQPGIRALRITTNTYSVGAELQVYVTQPRENV